jgi:hypothetical protein
MTIWVLKEQKISPEHGLRQLVHKRGLVEPQQCLYSALGTAQQYSNTTLGAKEYFAQSKLYLFLDRLFM